MGNGIQSFYWVKPNENDAFLAIDLNNNGAIDDGSELFGQGTKMFEFDRNAFDGFEALAQYDYPYFGGNGDGHITKLDSVWDQLVLWLDSNADGISTPNEIFSLDSTHIKKIKLRNIDDFRSEDEVGNVIYRRSWVKFNKKAEFKKSRIVDVYFNMAE